MFSTFSLPQPKVWGNKVGNILFWFSCTAVTYIPHKSSKFSAFSPNWLLYYQPERLLMHNAFWNLKKLHMLDNTWNRVCNFLFDPDHSTRKFQNFLTQYLREQKDLWHSHAPWSSALLVSVSYFIFSKVRLIPACLALKLCGNFICRRNNVIYGFRNWVLRNCLRTDDNTNKMSKTLLCWPVLVSANFYDGHGKLK